MSIAEANLDLPPNFTGVVKLFPLPNLVLFPGVIQPLHIFEPRYRQLLRDAIDSDQLIAMAKLKPNIDPDDRCPGVHSTICVGKIVTHAELPDGRYNLLLLGAKRAKIIRELASDLPYRLADVKLQSSQPIGIDTTRVRQQMIELFEQLVDIDTQLDRETLGHLMDAELPFGLLLDLLTFSCGASLKDQQEVLETINENGRAQKVIEILQSRLAATHEGTSLRFPPSFSYN